VYEACTKAYPDADVREIFEILNHIAYRHKLLLKTNAALERHVHPDKLRELMAAIAEMRRKYMALQLESGFKYMRM
jgi:hypothetical protein